MCLLKNFRKEGCEKELAQIEKDLEKLNKAYIFVDRSVWAYFINKFPLITHLTLDLPSKNLSHYISFQKSLKSWNDSLDNWDIEGPFKVFE